MNSLWPILLLANFSRSTNEEAAYLFRNGVFNPKSENLEGSIDVNGVPSTVPTPLPSDLHQEPLRRDLPNGGFHSVEPSGIQPKLLDTQELQAGLRWKNQNDGGKRELNSLLTWWWIKWNQQLDNEQQHSRWRQPPNLNQQQYYPWQRQQLIRNSDVQNLANVRRQNSLNQGNGEETLSKSQLNQDEELKNITPQDKFIWWGRITTSTPNGLVYGDGQLEENKQRNSTLVEGQNEQKLGNSFAEKSQNQAINQPYIRNENVEKQNKILHLSNINHSVSPTRLLDSRQQVLEKEEQTFGLHSSQLPSSKLQLSGSTSQISPKHQIEQQSSPSTFFSTEADEEYSSSSESNSRNKELYPIWKPPLPGLEVFPVVDTHTVKNENLLPKRPDNVKSLAQAGSRSRSDKQSRTSRDLYVQRETWVFGVNLSYKKLRKNNNVGFPEQSKLISQPTSPYQQTNSILQGEEKQPAKLSARNNELFDQMKPNWGSDVTATNLSSLPRSLDIPTTQEAKMSEKLNGDRNDQKHQNKIEEEYSVRRNQTKDDVPSKDVGVSQDTKSNLSPQKSSLQVPSHQRKIQVNSLSEKSLQSDRLSLPQPLSLVPHSEAENMQPSVRFQKFQIIPPPNLTATSKSPMTAELAFHTTEISAQIDEKPLFNAESNTDPRSQELKEFGSNVDEIVPRFTNKTHLNSEGHPVVVKSDTPERSTSNKMSGEVEKSHSGIFSGSLEDYNLNATANPFQRVLEKPQKVEKNKTNPEYGYSNLQLAQKVLSSSYVDSNHITSKELTNGSQVTENHQLFGSDEANFARLLKKRTLDSRGNSPKETDNQRLSNMESLGGPMNIDPYAASLQNTDPSKSSVDMELSSNELEYLFQAISSGMKLLMNKIMGNSR